MHQKLNDDFTDHLASAARDRWGLEIETSYNFFAGNHVTTRVDGEDFTPGQCAWLAAFEQGYLAAMEQVDDSVLDGSR